MFPVHIYDKNKTLPNETCYVVAGDGVFLHKHTKAFSGFAKVPTVAVLDPAPAQWSEWHLKKISLETAFKIRKFFAKVVELHDAESCVVLYYDPKTDTILAEVNEQTVSKARVDYDKKRVPGLMMVGTIHSHCDFEAFHSGVDHRDEKNFDGLHCTFGHNDRTDFISITACVVVNGVRTKLKPEDVIDGIEHVEEDFYRFTVSPEVDIEEWLSKVHGG